MASLTAAQLAFIKSQRLSTSWFYDGTGLSKTQLKEEMEIHQKYFYFGGAPCKKEGHTLRSKAGHCIECDTSRIAYQMRSCAKGYIYVAYSPSTKLVKIGFSGMHPQDRGAFLRNQAYGNIQDWDIKKAQFVERDAGKLEFLIQSDLEAFQKPIIYEKNRGHLVECREIFDCDLQRALEAFQSCIR